MKSVKITAKQDLSVRFCVGLPQMSGRCHSLRLKLFREAGRNVACYQVVIHTGEMDVAEFIIGRKMTALSGSRVTVPRIQTYARTIQISTVENLDEYAICSCVHAHETWTSPPSKNGQSSSFHPFYFWRTQHVLDSVIKLLQTKHLLIKRG